MSIANGKLVVTEGVWQGALKTCIVAAHSSLRFDIGRDLVVCGKAETNRVPRLPDAYV